MTIRSLTIPINKVLSTIAAGGKQGEEMENYLYLQNHLCNRFIVIQNSGDDDDVRDNYHEAFMAIVLKIRSGDAIHIKDFRSYLKGTCYNLWMKELNRRGKNVTKTDFPEPVDMDSDIDGFDTQYDRFLMKALERLAKKCFDVLKKFYFDKERDNDVFMQLGYNTTAALRQKRKQCIGRLRTEYNALQELQA